MFSPARTPVVHLHPVSRAIHAARGDEAVEDLLLNKTIY